jgi:predicted NAD/FAD-binding protein
LHIAIIGTGISGLYAARRLSQRHTVTLFEAKHYAGGHTHTVDVEAEGRRLAIDTGFIVFNEHNYPGFCGMLGELGVTHQPSDMSFSFSCRETGLEYRGGPRLVGLFAQRTNLFRGSFLRMLRDIAQFNRCGPELIGSPPELSLGDFLARKGFGGPIVDHYLLPMAGAIWSAEPRTILDFPARQFGTFFTNHGLMQVSGRLRWRTVTGGARQYVRALTTQLAGALRLDTPVEWIQRLQEHVLVKPRGEPAQAFDRVVLACHSDQALRLLRDPSAAERAVLGAIPYQSNETVLHTDESLLPRRRRAWAAWNYHRLPGESRHATVTYNLTTLQSLPTSSQFLVTLNATDQIDPRRIIMRTVYDHPVFNAASLSAQHRHGEISGTRHTFYCGAYWGYGFHEDGVNSAIRVCEQLERDAANEQLHLQRTG